MLRIYRTWLSHGSLVGGGQLSVPDIGCRFSSACTKDDCGDKRISTSNVASVEVMRRKLGMVGMLSVTLIVWFPVVMGFIMPVSIFVDMSLENGDRGLSSCLVNWGSTAFRFLSSWRLFAWHYHLCFFVT